MKTHLDPAPTCKNCLFFQPEGHYQGKCQRLHASVRSEWVACNLALSAFGAAAQPVLAA
ncbi:hypothetical protein [Chamaesiphon minutus]|uniref:Uncharacterized protein n=1 Tax=Chamaesiphon minutus (strain ATCC 27169 / PCC 6605) TaxID=1173020 RepID=K9UQ33_CHAP6|nr:hypothetical protein [Chamaesiphon minutus]AFY96773.1 hypothetical protein Cha6605_5927 [Chamaesiphon minutus PCC 6605]